MNNFDDAKRFLQGLGLHIDEAVVSQVVNVLSGKAHQSLYSLYATRPDKPAPVCGKGSVYKIKKLYDEGDLQPYLDYLSGSLTIGEAKAEPIKGAEHDVPKESRTVQEPCEGTEETAVRKFAEKRQVTSWEQELENQALGRQSQLAMKSALQLAKEYVKKLPREEREDFEQELMLELLKRRVQDSKLALEVARELWFKLNSEGRYGSFK